MHASHALQGTHLHWFPCDRLPAVMAEPAQGTGPASVSPPSSWSYAALKNNLKKYGRTGIAVYLGISFCVTTGFYVAIEQHLDVRKFIGLEEKKDQEPGWLEKALFGKGSSLALAIICSKAMVPIKLPVAVAVTPYVHRTIQNVLRSSASAASVTKGV